MPDHTIICPHCNKEIPLTETLSQQIRENIQKELEAEAQEKERALKLREKAIAEKEKEIETAQSTIEQKVAIGECKSRLTKGYVKLDPALKAEKLITRWRLWCTLGTLSKRQREKAAC